MLPLIVIAYLLYHTTFRSRKSFVIVCGVLALSSEGRLLLLVLSAVTLTMIVVEIVRLIGKELYGIGAYRSRNVLH